MNIKRRRLCTLLLASALPLPARSATAPLSIGLFPNLSPQRLFTLYQPLADYLEHELGRPVRLYTAKNIRAFAEDTQRGDFDIVLTAPHLAWLAENEAGYRPLATYPDIIKGLLVVATSSGLRAASELKGRDIAIPDPLSIVTLLGEAFLNAAGLQRERDYRFISRGTHSNAAAAVIGGDVPAAIVGVLSFGQLPEAMRSQLRIIGETAAVKSFFFMAHPRLSQETARAVQAALLAFSTTAQGRVFLAQNGFERIVAADVRTLADMARYAEQTRRLLKDAHR